MCRKTFKENEGNQTVEKIKTKFAVMRVFTSPFVNERSQKCNNTHHSFFPIFFAVVLFVHFFFFVGFLFFFLESLSFGDDSHAIPPFAAIPLTTSSQKESKVSTVEKQKRKKVKETTRINKTPLRPRM